MTVSLVETGLRLAGLEALREAPARILSYAQAQDAGLALAEKLSRELGRKWLEACRLVPIPRGGLFVAGFLSYFLHSRGEQLTSSQSTAPVLLIDDCALSGTRLARFLKGSRAREVVFATLFSPLELRRSARSHEPRIRAFLSAEDLVDLSPRRFCDPEQRQAWRRRWQERRPEAYWIGLPELIVFPWGEPDHPVWNPATQTMEDGWRLAPPHECLKNWASLKLGPAAADRQYTIPRGIAFNLREDSVLLCRLSDGMVFELTGVAAGIWKGLAGYGDLQVIQDSLARRYEIDVAQLRLDLENFVSQLSQEGLLS